MIIHGEALEKLRKFEQNSIDLIVTDPPYGYSFMGKDWDKAVPNVEIWQECLRVLKPGAFCMVMSAPRSDVQMHMIMNLEKAGFRLDFTPIYWTYASGFPKAGNIGKLVDKRAGAERSKVIGKKSFERTPFKADGTKGGASFHGVVHDGREQGAILEPATDQAKALDGSYAGFQPKPAVEVIIIAMKPLSEKTFVDQALANGKGISWLNDGRIPISDVTKEPGYRPNAKNHVATKQDNKGSLYIAPIENTADLGLHNSAGRFPANLLVSDDVLNDGVDRKSGSGNKNPSSSNIYGGNSLLASKTKGTDTMYSGDSGSYSRYFDLDKWANTLPFLIVPKASKSEKNEGLHKREGKLVKHLSGGDFKNNPNRNHAYKNGTNTKNHHPTVKPLKLMSYLITLGSRKGDTVLDPFAGSGTTILAAEMLGRKGIGIERETEYVEIAEARLTHEKARLKQEVLL